eukprot:2689046-Rhodomonas_salina.1
MDLRVPMRCSQLYALSVTSLCGHADLDTPAPALHQHYTHIYTNRYLGLLQLLASPNDDIQALAAGICRNLSLSEETESELVEAGALGPLISLVQSPNPQAQVRPQSHTTSARVLHNKLRFPCTCTVHKKKLRFPCTCFAQEEAALPVHFAPGMRFLVFDFAVYGLSGAWCLVSGPGGRVLLYRGR